MTADAVVIGGGVSGLAVACDLMQRGRRVLVAERQVRVGGKAVSERFQGFLMEHGPSSVSAAFPQAAAWSRELGLEGQRLELGAGIRRRYLTDGRGLHAIAIHPLGFLTSGYLSVHARARLVAEVLVPKRGREPEETVAEFCGRRFGREFVDRVIDPLVGGMFASEAARLSMPATFPKLVEMERRHRSILLAMIHSRLRGRRMPERRLFSWREGIAALPGAMAARLGAAVKRNVAIRRIQPLARGFRIDAGPTGTLEAKAVVIATQPHVTAALLSGVDAEAAEAAAAIDAPPLAAVFLGYRRSQVAHPLDGLGYLTPAGQGRFISGALFCSTMFAERAPEDHVALIGYVGGSRAPNLARLPADDLVELTRAEFADLLGVRGEPVIARVRQWPLGLPQYSLGHGARTAAVLSTQRRRPGLFVTGNYLSGASVSACLAQAAATASHVHEHLTLESRAGASADGSLPALTISRCVA